MNVNLVLPNQLFKETVFLNSEDRCILLEEYLFFSQFKFHKMKLAYHRSTMKFYEDFLKKQSLECEYISANQASSDVRCLIDELADQGVVSITLYDPCDDWIERRIHSKCSEHNIQLTILESPMYINIKAELSTFFKPEKKKFFQTSFYKQERKKRNILITHDGEPEGGQWTFDADNRKKYPKNKVPPAIQFPNKSPYWKEACMYVEKYFPGNYGELVDTPFYPMDYETTSSWLDDFFTYRFHEFGPYEDAIVAQESFLNHSVLTPMMNIGLITPKEVLNRAISFAMENEVPINSLEGFVRQILGWREFIRGVYVAKGRQERTTNFWNFTNKLPKSFYDGTTGIDPIDITIKKLNKTAYSHHIERLMVLSNFMVLCEIDPDEVYKWFMELYIDAYDWVMVPNVYGMSLFADGGLMSTKPYISSSNYLIKMSNYNKGPWQEIWDALFWRFIDKHRDFFLSNPRLSMMVRNLDKMDPEKRASHLERAEQFLEELKS